MMVTIDMCMHRLGDKIGAQNGLSAWFLQECSQTHGIG